MDQEDIQNTSPIPPLYNMDQLPMTFFEALAQVYNGKRITKIDWNNNDTYGLLTDGRLKIKLFDKDKPVDWIICDADMAGLDWIILD